MLRKRRDLPERTVISSEEELNKDHGLGRGGILRRGISPILNLMGSMFWKRREASDEIFINCEWELNKKHALEEQGYFIASFHQFAMRIE